MCGVIGLNISRHGAISVDTWAVAPAGSQGSVCPVLLGQRFGADAQFVLGAGVFPVPIVLRSTDCRQQNGQCAFVLHDCVIGCVLI